MIAFAVADVRLGQRLRFAAGRRYLQEAGRRIGGRKDDRVVRTPARAPRRTREPAERNGRASGDRHLLQFGLVKESHPVTVRRDERRAKSCDAGERPRLELIDRADHHLLLAGSGAIDDPRSVR